MGPCLVFPMNTMCLLLVKRKTGLDAGCRSDSYLEAAVMAQDVCDVVTRKATIVTRESASMQRARSTENGVDPEWNKVRKVPTSW